MGAVADFIRAAKAEAVRAAEDDLVTRYLPVAIDVALHYKYTDVDLGDLLGVANLALVEAARTYPESRAKKEGMSFGAYAATTIHWAVRRAIWDHYCLVRIPESIRPEVKALRDAAGGKPEMTDEEVFATFGWSSRKLYSVRQALRAMKRSLSLDEPIRDEDGATRGELLPSPAPDPATCVAEEIDERADRRWLISTVQSLPPMVRAGVSLRFGLPVPGLERLALRDVIRVGLNMALASHGAAQLREVRRREFGDVPAVVRGNEGSTFGEHQSRTAATGKGSGHRAFEMWQRYSSGPWSPPALAEPA